jgi:DNA (cytosine-5)-methyltransferase 1
LINGNEHKYDKIELVINLKISCSFTVLKMKNYLMLNKKYRYIDLFAGIGGFRYAFDKVGFECVFSSEFNPECQYVYEKNFGEKPYGDITKINPNDIPDFDILIGGFPCQPFSISGLKKGFEDTRGTLFFDICRIAEIKQPKVLVLENVKNLIHHDNGKTFKTIINSLIHLDYNVTYKILNAKDFGVPQNRERIFIIASKNNIFQFSKLKKTKSKSLKYFLDKSSDKFEYLNEEEYTLIRQDKISLQASGLIFVGYRNKDGWKKGVRPNTTHLSRVHRQPNRIYSVEGYHPTIPSQEVSGRFFIYIPEERRVRKLTINECYRIMGFPENFIKYPKLTEQYKQIGNSVSIPVIESIANNILEQNILGNDKTRSQ